MANMLAYLWLVVGFILLIKGADFFVEGSAGVAKSLHIPEIIIGMTIVAMGTSAPECAVSTVASIKGNNGIAISNAVGSNICNLLLVCGLCAVIRPLPVKMSTIKREFPFAIIAQVVLLFVGADYILFGKNADNIIGRIDAIILILLFIFFICWMIKVTMRSRKDEKEAKQGENKTEEDGKKPLSMGVCFVYVVLGIAAIIFGSDLAVDSATVIAKQFGLNETMIGLTVIAIGTSLPELVTSLVAAKKGQVDMAIGNVIGSNIFNVLFVLGVASVISPIPLLMESVYDMIFLNLVSVIVLLFASTDRKIGRMEGAFMLFMYAADMIYVCMR